MASLIFAGIELLNRVPRSNWSASLDLADPANLSALADALCRVAHERSSPRGSNRGDETDAPSGAGSNRQAAAADPITSAAHYVSCGLSAADMITQAYYEDFPTDPDLFVMVKQITTIFPAAMRKICGDGLPKDISAAWPYFAALFLHHREHAGSA